MHVSPASHTLLPQQEPQSLGQLPHVSPMLHVLSPQVHGQSSAHVVHVSPFSQTPFLHTGHAPQSVMQVEHVSLLSH